MARFWFSTRSCVAWDVRNELFTTFLTAESLLSITVFRRGHLTRLGNIRRRYHARHPGCCQGPRWRIHSHGRGHGNAESGRRHAGQGWCLATWIYLPGEAVGKTFECDGHLTVIWDVRHTLSAVRRRSPSSASSNRRACWLILQHRAPCSGTSFARAYWARAPSPHHTYTTSAVEVDSGVSNSTLRRALHSISEASALALSSKRDASTRI